MDLLPNTISETVIQYTKAHFARYGIPEIVITDNGPQFQLQQYGTFAATWKFYHHTIARAESAVKIAKILMAKADADHQDLQLTILDWRKHTCKVHPT